MKVTLIHYTRDAVDLLLYTKATRLTLGQETREKIAAMSEEEKLKELDYMSNTIPSSWEFVDYTFEILDVTRGFTHQFVRTRTGSYAQQTMRMLDVGDFGYLVPKSIDKQNGIKAVAVQEAYQRTMEYISAAYRRLIELGIPAEDARGILPTNIHTNIIAKFNLRTLSEMTRKRSGGRVQEEYRDVLNGMIAAVIEVHPWAEKFLFPRGRGVFDAVEKFISLFRDKEPKLAVEALKDIDRARQEIG